MKTFLKVVYFGGFDVNYCFGETSKPHSVNVFQNVRGSLYFRNAEVKNGRVMAMDKRREEKRQFDALTAGATSGGCLHC